MITVPCVVFWQNLDSLVKTLHITNGDSAVSGLKKSGIEGDFLPWRDVLHVGPVPDTDSWADFDRSRVDFMVASQWGDRLSIEKKFTQRRQVMQQLQNYQKIYLWFEHDLYDQLQLLQILHWMSQRPTVHDRVHLIVTDLYLGQACSDDFYELFRFSEVLTPQHLNDANTYWRALVFQTPALLVKLNPSESLPFMLAAFKRLCLEYPNIETGLNKIQHTVLQLLAKSRSAESLFMAYQKTEAARFLGDSLFLQILENMATCQYPLIKRDLTAALSDNWQQKLIRTEFGLSVLKQEQHNFTVNEIDQWIGGVHLNNDHIWCYDNNNSQFIMWD